MALFSIDTIGKAAKKGRVDLVTRFLEEGQDPDKSDTRGLTPLHYAANEGHLEVVKVLVEKANVDIDKRKDDGFNALMYAIFSNHHEIATYLLKNGAETTCSNNDFSPLHYVIMNGEKAWARELLRLMLETGANPDCIDKLNQTPLEHAFDKKNATIVKMLVELGADVRKENKQGLCILHQVVGGADFSLQDRLAIVEAILKTHVDPNIPSRDGSTPLHIAVCQKGKQELELVNLLIEYGADPQLRDSHGRTPLDVAMEKGSLEMQGFLQNW